MNNSEHLKRTDAPAPNFLRLFVKNLKRNAWSCKALVKWGRQKRQDTDRFFTQQYSKKRGLTALICVPVCHFEPSKISKTRSHVWFTCPKHINWKSNVELRASNPRKEITSLLVSFMELLKSLKRTKIWSWAQKPRTTVVVSASSNLLDWKPVSSRRLAILSCNVSSRYLATTNEYKSNRRHYVCYCCSVNQ